jgi:hypothetical protein
MKDIKDETRVLKNIINKLENIFDLTGANKKTMGEPLEPKDNKGQGIIRKTSGPE